MNYKDEILFEQYFSYKGMTRDQRNFYINLLLHTKEIESSEVYLNNNSSSKYDLQFLNLSEEDYVIKFDGAISNESENRMIFGDIINMGNKLFVRMNIYRCNDLIYGDNKEYSVIDEFVFKNERIIRKSRYDSGYFEAEVDLFTEMETEEYLENKCNEIKLKR